MSTPKQDRAAENPDPEKPAKEVQSDEKAAPQAGQDYVFKIAPADPKNAFDFEDVADK